MKKYLIFLSTFVPFGPLRTSLLLKYFGSPRSVWQAKYSDLILTGLSKKLVDDFTRHRDSFDETKYLKKLTDLEIDTTSKFENGYPKSLKEISNPPVILYKKGKIKSSDENAISIVGSRRMSPYGKDVAGTFSRELAIAGLTIISGLARGIDTQVHREVLDVRGRTIAVIGSGLDRIYPPENTALAKEIIKSGSCILSEYPLGYPALPSNFPARNRIISALSKGVVVIEGRQKSGTLLTASSACEQGKEVYAIPGNITSALSEAPLYLLQNGAKLAVTPKDILRDLNINQPTSNHELNRLKSADPEELKLLDALENSPLHLDELSRMVLIDVSLVGSKLTMMEMKGYVKNLGGGVYKRL